jgi:dolichyl-phosphate beta-glucosyltransferase
VPNANIALSLVIPAYNEALRLPPYLAQVRPCLESRYGDRYEVIVVDDASTDGLAQVVERLAAGWPQLRCIRHPENRGKGAAVRTGMLAAHGELLLFADADGATPIEEEGRLAAAIHAGTDLAVGSRLVRDADRRCSRPWLRRVAGRLFAAVARRLLRLPVRDTQCGFKMFRGAAGHTLFSLVQEPRYLFDLEVLALARRFGYQVAEVPVNWSEVPGGRFSLIREFPRVLVDLLRLRRRLKKAEEG